MGSNKEEYQDEFLQKIIKENERKSAPKGIHQRIMQRVEQEAVFYEIRRQPILSKRGQISVGVTASLILFFVLIYGNYAKEQLGKPTNEFVLKYLEIVDSISSVIFATGNGIVLSILLGAIGLLFVEQVLSRRFSY
ncbi:MAG: hypothetical protein ABEH43_06970 [Flavobacteriales bacterium]